MPSHEGNRTGYFFLHRYPGKVACPRFNSEAVQTILEFMGKKGVPAETFQDNTIVDKLTREGFFDKIYKKS